MKTRRENAPDGALITLSLGLLLAGLACCCAHSAESNGRPVDGARIANADSEPGNWLSYGRTYSEQRYSPLARINDKNAQDLGLAWFADLDTNRAQEATPLIVDGVMYVSTAWSLVKAYDARTGRLLWAYDPQVHRELGVNACCDVGNRGVAAWNHKIFVGAYDGRLVALSTFEVGGEQYIAVLSGWGGSYAMSGGKAAAMSGNLRNVSRLLVFKLGGTAALPPIEPREFVINPPPEPTDAASIARGDSLFYQYCSACHGEHAIGGGMVPDLRASNFLAMDFFYNIVLDGALKDAGMAPFKSVLSRDDVTAIRNYVIHRANQDGKAAAPAAH